MQGEHTFHAPSRVARPGSSDGAAGGDSSANRRSARARTGPYTCCAADTDSACQIPLPSSANALPHIQTYVFTPEFQVDSTTQALGKLVETMP